MGLIDWGQACRIANEPPDPKNNITQFFYENAMPALPTRIIVDTDPRVANDEHTTTSLPSLSIQILRLDHSDGDRVADVFGFAPTR